MVLDIFIQVYTTYNWSRLFVLMVNT